jgi:hypothetical protein
MRLPDYIINQSHQEGIVMATSTAKPSKLLTPRFRVSFPSVFEKASYNNGTPRFSLVGLFFPEKFTDDEKTKWKAILAALNAVSIEAFKKPMKDLDRGVYKLPFHKGDEKTYEGYGDPAMRYCTMANSKRRPNILDLSGNAIGPENASEFYAGCWARASVNPYAFNNIGKGLALGLGNLQKLGDDKSFEGFTSAEDDFGSDDVSGDFSSDSDFDVGGADESDPTA